MRLILCLVKGKQTTGQLSQDLPVGLNEYFKQVRKNLLSQKLALELQMVSVKNDYL